ncbi:hypothetical protein D3C73_874680 [compost metagenome]
MVQTVFHVGSLLEMKGLWERVKSIGIPVRGLYVQPEGISFRFPDPEGNQIMVLWPQDLQDDVVWIGKEATIMKSCNGFRRIGRECRKVVRYDQGEWNSKTYVQKGGECRSYFIYGNGVIISSGVCARARCSV